MAQSSKLAAGAAFPKLTYSWSDIRPRRPGNGRASTTSTKQASGEKADQLTLVQALSSPLPAVSATLVAVAPAIAFADLTALFFVDAGAAQLLAVRRTSAAFLAIATTIAFAHFTALFFVDAGAAQALAIAPTSVLHLVYEAFREAGAADINADRRGYGVRHTCETQAGSQDHGTDDCLHVGSLPVS